MFIVDRIRKILFDRKVKNEGGPAFSPTIRQYYKKKHGITIGYGTYGGCFSPRNIPPGTNFGNYCSIAQDVKIFRANHPLKYFTMHPLFYNPSMGFVKTDQLSRPSLSVGHDVWIGASSIILPSVHFIGNGAVIGAGSVVSKDVLPYSIVAGNPAKFIRFRFTPDIIDKLEQLQWWNMSKEDLIRQKNLLESITNGG